jgi:hypothetical protein
MKSCRFRLLVVFTLICSLRSVASAETLMESLRQYAEKQSAVILIHRPYVVRGMETDPFKETCSPFASDTALMERMTNIGYHCTRDGAILSCQFRGKSDVQGVFLLSRAEYDILFDSANRLVRSFHENVPRDSLFSERLIDSFPENDRAKLANGIPVASFTNSQRRVLDAWIFNAAFNIPAERIEESFEVNKLLTPANELSMDKDSLTLYWKEDETERSFRIYTSEFFGSKLPMFRQATPDPAETLGNFVTRVGRTSGLAITVEDAIKDREIVVLGAVEKANAINLLRAVGVLGEWNCIVDAKGKAVALRARRTGLVNRGIQDIDPLLRRLIHDYVVTAVYGPNYEEALKQIAKERMESFGRSAAKDMKFLVREGAIVESPMHFKRVIVLGLISDLGRFKTPRIKISQLTKREYTALQAALATNIYGSVGPRRNFVIPSWYSEIDSGVLFASFFQDGQFTRSNLELRLRRGEQLVPAVRSEGSLYHPNLGY